MMRQLDRAPRKARVDPPLLLAFLLPLFAVAPLAAPGYFELRSGFTPIFALTDRLSRSGDLAWAPAVGTTYSLLGGDGALPYWLAALPAALGASSAAAVKWVMAASLVAGSAGAFFWLRRAWPDGWPAMAGAAVYVLNPLTLSLVYREGAFAAVVLFGLLPWTLRAADRAVLGGWRAAAGLALLVAASIWTQAALGLAQVGIVVAYALISAAARRDRFPAKRWRPVTFAAGALSGLLLAALLWLPVLLARGFGGGQDLPLTVWMALGLPWLAFLGGWMAARFATMLGPAEADLRPALFAGLVALVLLVAVSEPRPVKLPAPIPAAALAIFGENQLALISVETEGTPGPEGRVAVEAVWQALRPLDRDYTVFFHVVGEDGLRYGQQDGMPLDEGAPTSRWQAGHLVTDRREAMLSPDAPTGGSYQYWLGLYDAGTGARLTTGTGDKFVFSPQP